MLKGVEYPTKKSSEGCKGETREELAKIALSLAISMAKVAIMVSTLGKYIFLTTLSYK